MSRAIHDARTRKCRRVWLITTNNNIRAIAFYREGVSASRRVKPSIPLRDGSGVPIAHELEFELLLMPDTAHSSG